MANVDQLLGDYADSLAEKAQETPSRRRRGPVIKPLSQREDDYTSSFFPESVSIMSPDSILIGESNAAMDLSNFPDRLQKVLESFSINTGKSRDVSIDFDSDPESREIIEYVENNDGVKKSVDNLASVTESKLDGLTDTVSMQSKRQIDTMSKSTDLLTSLRDIHQDRFEYDKDRDFDKDREEASRRADKTVDPGETSESINNPDFKDRYNDSGSGGLFGLGGLFGGSDSKHGSRLGRIIGTIGKAGKIAALLAMGTMLAGDIMQQFFGVDLIAMITNGFRYLRDNWENLADNAFEKLGDIFNDLPGMLGNMVREVGTFLREAFTAALDMIPGFSALREATTDVASNLIGAERVQAITDAYDTGIGTTATLGGAALAGAGAIKANRFIQGRKTKATLAEEVTTQKPTNAAPDAKAKQGLFSKLKGKGKWGMVASTLGGLGLGLFGNDESSDAPKASADVKSTGYSTERFSGMKEQAASPAPDTTKTINKPVKPGMLSKVGSTLGRIPGLSLAFGGFDAYNTYKDDSLSDSEKNVQYAGAGGMLAGGAAGAAAGSILGPVGTVVGGALGAYLGEEAVESIASGVMGWFGDDEPKPDREPTPESNVLAESRRIKQQEQERERIDNVLMAGDPAIEQQILEIHRKSGETISLAKAQEIVRNRNNLPPVSQNNEFALVDRPVTDFSTQQGSAEVREINTSYNDIEPRVEESNPIVNSDIPDNNFVRENVFANTPPVEVVVNSPPPPEPPKPAREPVVAKTVKPKEFSESKTAMYRDRPRLNNVPVLIDDASFTLLNLGYI